MPRPRCVLRTSSCLTACMSNHFYPPRLVSLTDTEMSHLRRTAAGSPSILTMTRATENNDAGIGASPILNQSDSCGPNGHRWLSNGMIPEAGGFLGGFCLWFIICKKKCRLWDKTMFVRDTKKSSLFISAPFLWFIDWRVPKAVNAIKMLFPDWNVCTYSLLIVCRWLKVWLAFVFLL